MTTDVFYLHIPNCVQSYIFYITNCYVDPHTFFFLVSDEQHICHRVSMLSNRRISDRHTLRHVTDLNHM